MDLFPDLGEEGLWDELFYFGPLLFLVLLAWFLFWLSGRLKPNFNLGERLFHTAVMFFVTNSILFVVLFVVVRAILNEAF